MYKYFTKKRHHGARIWLGAVLLLLVVTIAYPFRVHSSDFANLATLEKSDGIGPDEKIVIRFSMPVATASIENNFSIAPSQEVVFNWEDNNKKVTISPKTFWKQQSSYVISLKNGRNILFQKIEKNFEFKTVNLPKMVSIFPSSGEKNISVSMEDPVTVNFDKSLDGYNTKFVVSPEEPLEYQLNGSKTQIKLLAKNDFKWETDYSIEVYIKYNKQSVDDFVKVGQTNFRTQAKPLPVEWDKDFAVRVEQAKQFTQPQILSGKYIDVNLTQQVMVIFEDGKPLDSYLISSGKRGLDTPVGTFKTENKSPRAWSKGYGLWMPNWMAIIPSGKIGIHELPVWPGGYQEGANHLGTPVSHGCMRLGPGAAKRVYDWADLGTPVVVHN